MSDLDGARLILHSLLDQVVDRERIEREKIPPGAVAGETAMKNLKMGLETKERIEKISPGDPEGIMELISKALMLSIVHGYYMGKAIETEEDEGLEF